MTIRRDLTTLEYSNLINRTYGKAHIIDETKEEFPFEQRSHVNLALKQKIAKTTCKYLDKISSIYIDGSTTATELIKILPPSRSFTIITNSMEALKVLHEKSNVRTFVIGGFLAKDHNTFDDDTTIEVVKQIYVDATITSCSGFSKSGIFNDGITGTQIKRIMLKNSSKNFILADHTKIEKQGLFLLSSWDLIDYLITDMPIETKCLEQIQAHNVKVSW